LINYCCVPVKCETAFFRYVDLQNPPHKWHGFWSITYNPEVSSPLLISKRPEMGVFGLNFCHYEPSVIAPPRAGGFPALGRGNLHRY
jgi:hypothetical protein